MPNNTTRRLIQDGASGVLLFIFTGNPVLTVPSTGRFVGNLYARWRDARERKASSVARAKLQIAQIAQRAQEIAGSAEAGDDVANWVRAERELLTRVRADEIANSPETGTPEQNWLRAELEIATAQRARALRDFGQLGSNDEIWRRAEHEAPIVLRAEQIRRDEPGDSDEGNWIRAEHEIYG